MSSQIELNPRPRAVPWMPRPLTRLSKDVVIVLRVASEIFLDRRKFRFKDSVTTENKRLQAASHAAIPVREWMYHPQIQVRHSPFDKRVRTVIPIVEIFN